MLKEFLRGGLIIALGIWILLTRDWYGWVIVVAGVFSLAIAWRYRSARRLDPLFLADAEEVGRLSKSDPEAAEKLAERAFIDADEREKQRAADLRRRAGTDRRAAMELRNWLRASLRIDASALQKTEGMVINPADRVRFREELNREASEKAKELAELEELLVDYPFYELWLDQATGYLRDFRSLPTGGPSSYVATLAPAAGILVILALLPVRSDIQVRLAVIGIALGIAVLGLVRPPAFWESAGVEDLRETLGDRMVALLCLAMGILIMLAAWRMHF